MTGDLRAGATRTPCDVRRPSRGETFLKDVFAMRKGSVGSGAKGAIPHGLAPLEEVVLRNKNAASGPPAVGPGFMRRSCTFVTEGSWRKSSFGIGSGQKETKDRLNLALQVRKKAAQLVEANGALPPLATIDSEQTHHSHARSSGRVSRLVGNLKSWSSSEDVRQSVVGALTRTVNVIKQRPGSKKSKPTVSKTTSVPSHTTNSSSGQAPPTKAKESKAKEVRPLPKKTPVPKKKKAGSVDKGVTPPPPRTIPCHGDVKSDHQKSQTKNCDMFRERLRRKSLQYEKGLLERAKPTERRGSLTEKQTLSVKEPHQERRGSLVTRWLRHLHDAQANYARDSRNRRPHPPPHLPDPEESPHSTDRDVDDGADAESTGDCTIDTSSDGTASLQNKPPHDALDPSFNSSSATNSALPQTPSSPETLAQKTESGAPSNQTGPPSGPQGLPCAGQSSGSGGPRRRMREVQIIQIVEGPSLIQPSEVKVSQGVVLSAEPVLTPIELLRRKDLKIREELEEKQNLIADILNIPRHDFENVADMAGEVGLTNREPRELVLGAIYQAKKLQETLNEIQMVRDSDIIAAQACSDSSKGSLPLYHNLETTEKLLTISGALTQLLNSLMVLVSERDEERERMRKELISSRERIHQLHMQQNLPDTAPPTNPVSSTDPLPSQPLLGSSPSFQSQLRPPTPSSLEATSPQSSRPSSFLSVNSSAAEQSDNADQVVTDEEDKSEDPTNSCITLVPSFSATSTEKCGESLGDTPLLTEEENPCEEAVRPPEEDGGANT